jgi:hypothetical protein
MSGRGQISSKLKSRAKDSSRPCTEPLKEPFSVGCSGAGKKKKM